MRSIGAFDTQRLTRATFELTLGRPALRRLLIAGLALAAAIAAGMMLGDGASVIPFLTSELARNNARLAAELQRTRMELEMERATGDELRRLADELSGKVTDLTHQLEFLNSRGVSVDRTRPPQVVAE